MRQSSRLSAFRLIQGFRQWWQLYSLHTMDSSQDKQLPASERRLNKARYQAALQSYAQVQKLSLFNFIN